MVPTITTAKVMQNYTICIPKPIRQKLQLKKADKVMLVLSEDGIKLLKVPKSFSDLRGAWKDVFASLGGGEAFLKSERDAWED